VRLPQPDQPVVPQTPVLQPVAPGQAQAPAGQQQAPPPPFTLSKEEEAQLDKTLVAWQERSARVKTFRANFIRYEYDLVFGPQAENAQSNPPPRFVDDGSIAFGAPDKGIYSIDKPRQEYWISDGKAIFEYDYQKKRVTEHKLPPEMQGKEITNGPLPFLFGAPADQLKQRYYLRLITPAAAAGKEIWLQAVPRFQQDAANFRHAELILAADSMNPAALQVHQPGGKNRSAYVFRNVIVNDPLGWLKGDPFRAITPLGWERIVEEAPQMGRRDPAGNRRQ
jgi:TIGR03009 family protein